MENESDANLRNRAESDQATAIARNQLAGDVAKGGSTGSRIPWDGGDPSRSKRTQTMLGGGMTSSKPGGGPP